MAKNILKVPKFLSEIRSILLFLATLLVVTLVFVIAYKPAAYMHSSQQVSSLNTYIYSVIMISSGAGIVFLSRMLLYYIHSKFSVSFVISLVWQFVELLFAISILTVIAFFLGNKEKLPFSDMLWRVSLNYISVIAVPYIVTVLLFYIDERKQQISDLNKIIEATSALVPSESENVNFYDRGGKLSFSTRKSNVLFIEATDNYSNIHYLNAGKEETFILHCSMKQLDDPDRYKGLLRCHRSYMVNIENVKLLRKEKEGLVLELSQASRSIPVSRTYYESVVRFFAGQSIQ